MPNTLYVTSTEAAQELGLNRTHLMLPLAKKHKLGVIKRLTGKTDKRPVYLFNKDEILSLKLKLFPPARINDSKDQYANGHLVFSKETVKHIDQISLTARTINDQFKLGIQRNKHGKLSFGLAVLEALTKHTNLNEGYSVQEIEKIIAEHNESARALSLVKQSNVFFEQLVNEVKSLISDIDANKLNKLHERRNMLKKVLTYMGQFKS